MKEKIKNLDEIAEILSLKNDSDSSNAFVITLIEQPRIYTSMF